MKRIFLNMALIGCLGVSQTGWAATQAQIDAAWNKGLSWLLTSQHGDGGWSATIASGNVTQQGLGIQTTAAVLDALNAMNFKANYTYSAGIAWLSNTEAASVDALARQAVAVRNSGEDAMVHGARLASWRNDRLAWGAYPSYESSLPDTALGVASLLDVQGASYGNNDVFNALCQILPAQRPAPNNLWPYAVTAVATAPTSQSSGAIVPTVHAVFALGKASARFTGGTCGNGVVYTFSNVINAAISGLVSKKNIDNGYGDNGASGVFETALVLRAYKTAVPGNLNAVTAIDYLVAQQAVDGSWRGDALQTAEVLLALAASTTAVTQRPSVTVITDTDKDGVPDPVEALLGLNPNLADSRLLADGAGSIVTPPVQLRIASASPPASPSLPHTARIVNKTSADKVINIVIVGSSSGSVLSASRTWDKAADVEIFLAGSSMQLPAIEAAVASWFVPGTMDVFMSDSAANAGMYRAYYGMVGAGGVSGLLGKALLVHFSAKGGSYGAVASVARADSMPRMVVDKQCISANGTDHHWQCPSDRTTLAIPDAGLSDVEPLLHAGVNAPASARAVTADEVVRLNALRVNAMVSGVVVSKSLKDAGLRDVSSTSLAKIFSGGATSGWHDINSALPAQPVIMCRAADGAQPASNTLILNAGCSANSLAPKAEFSSIPVSGDTLGNPGLLVVENATANELVACLNKANTGGNFTVAGREIRIAPGSFAIGMLSTDHQPGATDQFDYIALDGMAPTKLNTMTGIYKQFTETWMQWRRVAVNGIAAPFGNTLAVLQALRDQMGNPEVLRDLPGTVPLTGAEGMQVSREGDSCQVPR